MVRGLRRRRVTVRPLNVPEFHALFRPAFQIFADAMGYPDTYIEPRIRLARSQLGYPGFTAFGAFEGTRLIGFAYGYRVQRGQWWAEEVARALAAPTSDTSRDWLSDAFELCEIHVSPDAQGLGAGRRLLEAVTAAQPCPVIILSTPTGPTKAAALYASAGYRPLASRFRFGGDPRDFEILAKVVDDG
ncbi:GNAT family N-acetyltransferase [Cumulibacter manganitolerans]|uniref:GNAT family N-acetyltransferase n=1 Tax=Cumulibacter manganitolerans TaxID=1884992 RepID=UPI0012966F2E|nr:GNAT family N-acetyltransferase [Cumulibacter manganitolerans]